ncbi:hypothetical protein [Zongyangia hominis]|uniref:hypothetical protein n=1 Tax=Zongyangia hominis TaxID=2763677 RepID=UPI0021CCD8CF|nr:hypothetical protein [Zongyangia hominis]
MRNDFLWRGNKTIGQRLSFAQGGEERDGDFMGMALSVRTNAKKRPESSGRFFSVF